MDKVELRTYLRIHKGDPKHDAEDLSPLWTQILRINALLNKF